MVHLCSYEDYLSTKVKVTHDSQKFHMNRELLRTLTHQGEEELARLAEVYDSAAVNARQV